MADDQKYPENDSERLRALRSYEILDSAPEFDFDALARVTAQYFSTAAAIVALMDSDRVWFKSYLKNHDSPQLGRLIADCAYAMMRPGELLMVNDLQKDPHLRHKPLVVEPPYLRFCAGAPIVDRNGCALGTITVVDTQPRELDENEQEVLRDLANMVMTALENRRRSQVLTKMALTDHLTGAANRAQFDRALEAEMAHAKRTGEPFSVLCMDLDGFKDINDHFGHPSGDEVLCEVAYRLQQQIRTEDTVSRLGGDEFGVVIRESSKLSTPLLAERISGVMTTPITLSNGESVTVGISIGMATYHAGIESPFTLLAQADSDLYRSKRRALAIR
ncbi:MAG: diguanylate cyclase [Gammaproteobacteria bacterium]|nr:diguanylate cyclase [Gammaproteobacteria bacterium]